MDSEETSQVEWGRYLRWCTALADIFFSKDMAEMPAYLDLEEDALRRASQAAGDVGGNPGISLAKAVRATLKRPQDRGGMFAAHIEALRGWSAVSGEPPPTVPLVAVLSLAAEQMREGEGFAANNYYDRLMPLLGVSSPEDKRRVIRAYRACSRELWEGINGWLEDLQGERGLPTAYSLAHAHVGLPMSQALVRATDREKLGRFFGELGMAPRSRMSTQDMEPLLDEWISRNPCPVSRTLRAMWRRGGARDRITEVACNLLETWTGSADSRHADHGADGRARPLLLSALLRTFPSPAVEFGLIGSQVPSSGPLLLVTNRRDGDPRIEVAIEELPAGKWRLADAERWDPRSLLEGRLQLEVPDGVAVERRPRRLVPLRKDPLLQIFVEAERLALGEDGLVLCQLELAPIVAIALELIARPGFRRLGEETEGCPEGWAIFAGVQVLTGLPEANPRTRERWRVELNALQPLATAQAVLQGGLQLPGRVRRWSSLVPPEIRIAAAEARSLEVEIEQVRLLTDRVLPVRQRFDRPVAILPIGPLQLPDGDYEIRVGAKESLRASTRSTDLLRLSLRSGDNPSPVVAENGPLVRVLDDGGVAVLTSRRSADLGRTLRGPVLADGSESDGFALQSRPVSEPAWWGRRSQTEVRQSSRSPSPIAVPAAELDECFHTGAHHIVLPPFLGRTTRSTIEGVCRGCGLVKRYPARYRPSYRRSSAPHSVGPQIDVTLVEPVPETRSISPDAALDALVYGRMGTASSFEQVSLQVDPSQLFVDRFLRALEALGHIEVARDPRTLAPLEWEIVPPALVELVNGNYCAAGHRGVRLERALGATVTQAGGRLERTPMAAAPTLLRVMGVSREVAAGIAAELSESTGFTVQVVPEASLRLASVLPAFSDLIGQLPRQPMIGYRSARRWDGDIARWYPVEDASVPGAYQLMSGATVYCLREPSDIDDGTMRRADVRIVKYAEALRLGRPLLGYHPETMTLYVPLGADLPLLYERAAVLASGSMPSPIERQRLLCYREIPVNLAEHLAALLSS